MHTFIWNQDKHSFIPIYTACTDDSDCTTNSLTPICDTSLQIASCVACKDSTDCVENETYNDLNQIYCKSYLTGGACTYEPDTDTDTDTSSDLCSVDSDCTSTYGLGATCVDATVNYCLPDAKVCSTDTDCIASECLDTAYISYCSEIVCVSDLGCSLVSGENIACSGGATTAGVCYQTCESDSDCGVDGYECQSSACVYVSSTSSSSSGIDQLTIFVAMIIMMINGLFAII